MARTVSLQRKRIRKGLGVVLSAEKNHGHEERGISLIGNIGLRAFCKRKLETEAVEHILTIQLLDMQFFLHLWCYLAFEG
jgi:hypothetical protein